MVAASKFSFLVILCLFLSGCLNHARFTSLEHETLGSSSENSSVQITQKRSVANPEFYLVKPGDTLYSIAFRFGLDYKKLAQANRINSPYRIYEEQSLALKEVRISSKKPVATVKKRESQSASNADRKVTKINSQKIVAASGANKPASVPSSSWKWPHNGKIVRSYAANSSSNKGIDIGGRIGDSVLAATDGIVVYAGNGLPGYGNLIIMEHPGSLLSAYAFAQQILVKEKDQIRTGQKIATMGKQGDQPGLHFEIRQNGKPVDPMKFLPNR